MSTKGLAITLGVGAAAGAVAILMMPRNNPTRRLAAKAANKEGVVAFPVPDRVNENFALGPQTAATSRDVPAFFRIPEYSVPILPQKHGWQKWDGQKNR